MSLIDSMMEQFCFKEKTRVPDGEGGFITTWIDGAQFKAVAVLDTTMEARIAEQEGVTSTYTVTTNKQVILEYHDVIKRVSDGSIFRVTSNGKDKTSPNAASFSIAQVTAERWNLPT